MLSDNTAAVANESNGINGASSLTYRTKLRKAVVGAFLVLRHFAI
jgi:hypothetical protein